MHKCLDFASKTFYFFLLVKRLTQDGALHSAFYHYIIGKVLLAKTEGNLRMQKKTDNSITIKDIASICGVSISTVSNVLNGKSNKVSEEVAKKILDTVAETGYRPNVLARNLRSNQTKTIGVLAEDLIVFSASSMIEGIMKCCEEQGYNIIIENMRLFGRWHGAWLHDEALFQSALQPVLSKIDSMNVDGLLYVGGHEHTVNKLSSANNLPIVMAYAIAADTKIPTFRLDDANGGYEAVKYLLSKGHRKIGIIAGEPDNTHTINRVQGVHKAMFEAGILFNPENIVYKQWNREGGYSGMKELFGKDLTAVFCMSDAIAAGAYSFLTEKGLTPGKDLSIMGYDNQEVASLITPTITTMMLPLEELGFQAAKKLISEIENPESASELCDVRIKSTLIERESVLDIN